MSKVKITKPKVIQDSQEDSSSELPLINTKKQQITAKKQVKTKKSAPVESSEQEDTPVVKAKTTQKPRKPSNASMDQESEKVQKKATKVVKTQTAPVRKVSVDKKKKKQESSSEQSEEEVKPTKKAVVAKSPLQKPVVQKKKVQQSSSEQSQEQQKPKVVSKKPVAKSPLTKPVASKKPAKQESSSEESEEEVKPTKKAVVTKSPLQKAKSPLSKPVVAKKKQQSSEQQSQEQVKPKNKVVAKKPVKKVESSEQQEQQKPKAPVRKASNDLKVVKKQQPKKIEQDDVQGQFEACVQGLSFNAYDNDIRELFESCGDILNLNVLMRPDGKPKGIAFVKFGRRSHLNNALAMNGQEHMGRSLKIEQARGKATNKGDSMPGRGKSFQNDRNGGNKPSFQSNATIQTPTLFIGGLSYNSTAESIKQHFSTSGAVLSARVVTDKQTGKPRGFGYIEFYDVQTAKSAYQTLNGSYLDGRAIRLDSAAQRERPTGSFSGGNRSGFSGGNRGGYGGDRGGFGGNSRNPGNSTVILSEDDKNAKKGAIGTFQGKKMTF